jgi:type IV secretory pathway VirB3-like protein
MAQQEPERPVWDPLPVADTRMAMKGGVPFFAIFPIFFAPCVLIVFTWNLLWFLLIPAIWLVFRWAYAGNPNRPFEWLLWVLSGAAFADWREWGGASFDPYAAPDPWSGLQ